MAEVTIKAGEIELKGDLEVVPRSRGLVIFAHGAGSSRLSPRNRLVASSLNEAGMSTLLFDLLTEAEDQDREMRFDIDLLTQRLIEVTRWLEPRFRGDSSKLGYFGASTGAAAALSAVASEQSTVASSIKAVVCRGGRPDLAKNLEQVRAPTLLIVGGDDTEVIELNEQAYARLNCEKKLEIVPGATHLFEEEGALEKVADLAGDWFTKWLS